MNTQEATLVLRKIQIYRPSQIIDDFTAVAWQEAFDDIRFEDALLAVKNLGRVSSKYLDPAQIRTEVERQLAERARSGAGDKCYICGGTWEQCARRHAFEIRHGVADPHQFESDLASKRNAEDSVLATKVKADMTHLLDGKNLRNKSVG
jgi:hypothetical protein